MSYNGYNHYSPYWQPTAGQTNPQNSTQNYDKSGDSFQPLSAYQNNQQPSQASTSQPASRPVGAYGSQGYGNVSVNRTGNVHPHDSTANFKNTNDRASIDGARVLGNLAYASTQSRDGSTRQAFNNRQQSNSNYGTGSPYGMGTSSAIQYRAGDERRNSNGSSREDVTKLQQATASPSFGYSADNHSYQVPSAGSNTQAHPQYSQTSQVPTEQHRNQYSQLSRPPSSPAVHQPHPRPGSQAAPSPTLSANQNSYPSQGQVSKSGSSVIRKEQARVHTPQSDKRQSFSQGSKGSTNISQIPQAGTTSQVNSTTKRTAAERSSAKEPATQRINEVRQPPIVDSGRDQLSNPATPAEPQFTTVDPSQVFNHTEYSRRQAAAAAEAAAVKKAVEEVEASRSSTTQPNVATSQVSGIDSESSKKDQMELEMKQMIEKMRDYKAKDPSLFTEIWEQVKKGQPPQRGPSKSFQGSATSPVVVNGHSPSPGIIQNQLPPESDLPTGDEFPPDFDRGRFPAQRRRRGHKTFSVSRKSTTPKGSAKPAASNNAADKNDAGNDPSETRKSLVPPEFAIPTPKVGQIFPDPRTQSMSEAMQQFHQNSTAPISKAQKSAESEKQATTSATTGSPRPPSIANYPQPVAAQPATAQPVPPAKTGGTYWPESKKKALADAARIALTTTPPNQGKTITTQEIHELLDQNPSYNQMCEILEYRGFVIDRGNFARVLLKAVPDLGAATNSTKATPTDTVSVNRDTPATPTVTASNGNVASKATSTSSATPTPGAFGMLVKPNSDGLTAPTTTAKPLPYSPPPAAAFPAPNGYSSPYAFAPPSAGQASERTISNGIHRDYRFTNTASWPANEPRSYASVTNHGRTNDPMLNSHPSLSLQDYPGSINGQASGQNGILHPHHIFSHLPNKQELARKRTFEEIVDLTQTLSDDEELKRHRPKSRIDEGTSAPSKSVKNVFGQVAQRQQNSGSFTPKPFKYKYSGRDMLLQSHDIIEPMNKRRDALRRSTYNPKTIARDILLGIGRHPAMAPLNSHLDVLKDRFKAVDYESDLSTFRWDLVDPEGEANAELSDMDDEVPVPVVNPVAHQHPAPVAVMIVSNNGGLVENHSALSHTPTSQESNKRGPYKKKGETPGIQPADSANTPYRQPLQSSPSTQNISDVPGQPRQVWRPSVYNNPDAVQTNSTPLNTSSSSTPGSTLKRKGRPPGAKNKQVRPDKGIPKKMKPPSAHETPSIAKGKVSEEDNLETLPSKEKTPSIGNVTPEKPIVSVPTRPRLNTSTPSKSSSLKKSLSAITPTSGIAVVIPSRSPSVVLASPRNSVKKERPKRTEVMSTDMGSPAPSYTIYPCLWENCPAELHNLETLKKHVRKHRRAVDGVYQCLWLDCSDSSKPPSDNTQNEDKENKRLKFKTDVEWLEHIESSHLKLDQGIFGKKLP